MRILGKPNTLRKRMEALGRCFSGRQCGAAWGNSEISAAVLDTAWKNRSTKSGRLFARKWAVASMSTNADGRILTFETLMKWDEELVYSPHAGECPQAVQA